MKGKHFALTEKTKKRTKSIVLSIVAILELILMITSVTFSWFEGLSSLELEGSDFGTAAILNSQLDVGENTVTGDTYGEVIDLSDFYDTQKEVRLSPVSSADAKNFYASYDTKNTASITDDKYRKLTQEDINSNIIQFEFNVSAPHGATDFYLTEDLPKVIINGTSYDINNAKSHPYRFAFSDGAKTVILKNSTEESTADADSVAMQQAVSALNSDSTAATIYPKALQRSQEYAYYTDHTMEVELPDDMGFLDVVPIKPLFHVNKGETKTITVSIWMEAFDYVALNDSANKPVAGDTVSFDIKLCSSWSITRDITVYDYTAKQWIDGSDDSNITTALFARNADGDSGNTQYKFTYTAAEHKWTGKIPIALKNCEFLWGTIQNGKVNPSQTYGKFFAPNRGNYTTLTILGTEGACVWDLKPEELIKIDFRDYTPISDSDPDGWVNNPDDKGNAISLKAIITYKGKTLSYSLTDTPTLDQFNKNSWSCWIPNSVDQVNFSRRGYNSAGEHVEFNIWYGTGRGTSTVYRALGSGGSYDNSSGPYTLYVKIDSAIADKFYSTCMGENPVISFTETSIDSGDHTNRQNWDAATDKTNFSIYDYNPSNDTWPNSDQFTLTRLSTNSDTWYITLDQMPANGTYVTVWSRNAKDLSEIDINMSFGVFYLDNTNNNTITITTAQQLVSTDAYNNYALLGTLSSDGTGAGGNINTNNTSIGNGVWGELAAPTSGTYDSTFVHVSNVDYVKVTFTWNSTVWTMDMEKSTSDSTGRTWITRAMPNSGVTNIKFTDSNGNTWTDPGTATRSSYRKYFYAKDTNGNSTGWRAAISTSSSSGTTYYFKHYNTATTSVSVSYVTSVGVPFTFNLTKGSDNLTWSTSNIPDNATSVKYTDGTRTWNITDFDSSTPYCYALDNNQYLLRDTANYARIYLERNYTWSDIKIYYTGTGGGDWNNRPAMVDLGRTYSSSPLYCYLVPTDAGLIIFTGKENGADKQTVDITSYHNTDMRKFKFSSWNSSQNKANCSSTTMSASSLN